MYEPLEIVELLQVDQQERLLARRKAYIRMLQREAQINLRQEEQKLAELLASAKAIPARAQTVAFQNKQEHHLFTIQYYKFALEKLDLGIFTGELPATFVDTLVETAPQ
jgi:hypothetical protein